MIDLKYPIGIHDKPLEVWYNYKYDIICIAEWHWGMVKMKSHLGEGLYCDDELKGYIKIGKL